MKANSRQVFYVHKRVKAVINLAELRCMNAEDKVFVQKTMYDDILNIEYEYREGYLKSEVMDCYDWDIVVIDENISEQDKETYVINRKYVDACKKYNYIGYDIERENVSNYRQMERCLY